MVQCKACGGTYEPIGVDGMRYFHACPPLSAVEIAAKVVAGKLVLPVTETPAIAAELRTYERANKRDENVGSIDKQGAAVIKAAGDGTQPSAAPPAPVVVVPK